jgi:hypothetical protein
LLHDHGATHRIDYRCELDQHPVAGRLDDAPLVLGYKRVDQFAPVALKSGKRPFLVGPHEARIGGDIGAKDCRQPPFDALFHHCGLSMEMDSLTPLVEGVTTLRAPRRSTKGAWAAARSTGRGSPLRVDCGRLKAGAGRSGSGASPSLPRVPVIVCFLNRQ